MVLKKKNESKLLIGHRGGGSYEQPLQFQVSTVHFNVEIGAYIVTSEGNVISLAMMLDGFHFSLKNIMKCKQRI